jgi:AcrR family transcriptional regulator
VPPFANDLSSICRSRSATRFIDDHGAAMSATTPLVDTEDRPLRADAVRNRARLLEAADEAFTSRGTEASLDDIARSAGVGIGTLYRHFPTRDDLVEALIRSHSQRLLAQAADLLEADDPFDALRTWFRAMLHYSATYKGLATSFVEATSADRGRLANACQEQSAAGAALLARAQQHGVVRSDVTSDEAIDLVSAVSLVAERAPRTNGDRLLDLALDGLRP